MILDSNPTLLAHATLSTHIIIVDWTFYLFKFHWNLEDEVELFILHYSLLFFILKTKLKIFASNPSTKNPKDIDVC